MPHSQKKLATVFHKLNSAITQAAKDSENRMIPFGIFGVVAYLLYYLINSYILTSFESYETLLLRIIISVLCLFLILKNYWPKAVRPFLPIYWYLTLLYSMPFFISFMTLKNHASTAWIMNLLSVSILMMLLVNWASYTILFVLGASIAGLAYYLTTSEPFTYIPGTVSFEDIVSTFLISIIMGLVFSRNKEKIEQEKLQAMAAVGGSIAHELRNPLLAIKTGLNGIKKYFPALLTGYQKADANNLLTEKIKLDRFETLLTVVDDMAGEIQYANTMIDMLLYKVNPNIKSQEATVCSIVDCIDDALRRYPFNSTEQAKLVQWTMENDFNFMGSQLLIVHVLFNLIKNALFFIDDAGKGNIYIWTEISKQTNILHFKDTSKGIPAHVLSRLFTRFFSVTHTGTGLGLAFCKMIMTGMGGDIICQSKEGEYTEFILSFPKLKTVQLIPSQESISS